jgi:hypothetical protein
MFTRPGARPQSGTTVRSLRLGGVGELLLLEDDVGVAAEVAPVDAGLDRELAQLGVQVVRHGGERRVDAAHRLTHRRRVLDVELHRLEVRVLGVGLQERPQRVDPHVGEPDLLRLGVLEEVEGGGRALEAGAEDEESHRSPPLRSVSATTPSPARRAERASAAAP